VRFDAILPAVAGLAFALACGGPSRYEAEGVVQEVQREYGQVVIDHEDIPGLMPAMTMNFDVADPALLAGLAPGQRIAFVVEYDRRSYRVVAAEVIDAATALPGPEGDRARLANLARNATPAPDFALVDQAGAPLSLADLRGKALLLDFVYTRCPGPCPILTGRHVSVQKALPAELGERVQLVSITLDPEHDTPAALAAYAEARGADLANWSFLTGEPERVDAVLRSFGVGRARKPDGEIDHLVVTFLIDPQGRIVQRYMGLDHEAETLARDLRALAP
jgi:protein SCO1/2